MSHRRKFKLTEAIVPTLLVYMPLCLSSSTDSTLRSSARPLVRTPPRGPRFPLQGCRHPSSAAATAAAAAAVPVTSQWRLEIEAGSLLLVVVVVVVVILVLVVLLKLLWLLWLLRAPLVLLLSFRQD